jgi:hypothetical protein
MINVDYKFSDFIKEYQNLLMIRLGMSVSESSRYIVDVIEDIEAAVMQDISAFEFFQDELKDGVDV